MPGPDGDVTSLDDVLDRVDGLAELIRDRASESESLGRLTPDVVEALHDAGLFTMLIPVELGGLGFTIPESIVVIERVASFDASTAWTLAILADGPLFARFLAPDVFARLCADPRRLVAGTLNPMTSRAERADGGFVFSGTATYLSGSSHAGWILAAALVTDDGTPAVTDGRPEIRTGLFPIEQARCLDTWDVTGMRATGSSDWTFEDVTVSHDWTFDPFDPRDATDVFSAIPLWAQLGGALTACAVGTARNMIDRFVELAAHKVPVGNFSRLADRASAQIAVGEAEGLCQAARAVLVETVERVWARGLSGIPFDDDALARQRLGTVTAVRLAAQAIDRLHDEAGMSGVRRDTVLERCWRDVHTMTQHVILAPARFEIAGRVLLGLDPASPVI